MHRSIKTVIATATALGVSLGVASSAEAVPTLTKSSCTGHTYDHILGSYTNPGHANLPIRCGNSAFGLTHIIKRNHLTSVTSTMIQTTLTYGEQKDSGAKILFDNNCNELYLVAYGYNAYKGTDQKANPIGIVTAYDLTVVSTAQPLVTVRPAYRKDCPIYEPIGD